MAHLLTTLQLRLKDRLRYSRTAQLAGGLARATRARLSSPLPRRLDLLADAYRILLGAGRPDWVESALRPYVENPAASEIWRRERIGWPRFTRHTEPMLVKSIILKPPVSGREKGVLLLSFEYNLPPLLDARGPSRVLQDYTIICATSWSPTTFQALWSTARIPGADFFFMLSNAADLQWYQRLKGDVHPLPFYISDWIDPAYYRPRPRTERSIDILMVANWAPFKRHWLLFDALRKMGRKLRVVLVGQPETGRTVEHVTREAQAFGVTDGLEFRNRLTIDQVTQLQCDSKVTLVFSRREGSCVVVTESMFADAPVGLVEGAHMGSAAYINPATGVFLRESRIATDLAAFLDNHRQFEPRKWAMENIGCHVSARRLNATLREEARQRGQEWTRDIVPFCCRPDPVYIDAGAAQEMEPLYADFPARYGLSFERRPTAPRPNP